MAKHETDPVLAQLVRSVNESGAVAAGIEVPVTVAAHGIVLTGTLIAEERYFAEFIEGNPLMRALQPASGLLGKEYQKDVQAESDHHVHLREARVSGNGAEGLWRISLQAVDAWSLRAGEDTDTQDSKGPFGRLMSD